MKVVVIGANGQLGRAVQRVAGARGHTLVAVDRDRLDVRDAQRVRAELARAAPAVVINAAAYTNVDRAESERDLAFATNCEGAANVARACAEVGAVILHVSTDYVFGGDRAVPYREEDRVAPLGVYGASKAAGEREVHAAGGVVVRTSWLFEARGPSFVHTVLRLAAERAVLRIVADRVGCPTWADDLAAALVELAQLPARAATYHYCNDGETSWHGFATAIVEEARRHRALACERIEPIPSAEYPSAARRPAYSVLDTARIRGIGIVPPSWRSGLARVVAEVLG